MDEFGFDISGILTGEEAEELFNEKAAEQQETETEENSNEDIQEQEETDPVDDEKDTPQEKVGEEEDNSAGKKAVTGKDGGSSPNVYSSIANALKDDGIFSDIEDDEIKGIKGPEDFAELFEKTIEARLNEKQKRINDALSTGVQPDTIKMYEQTLQYLESVNDESVEAEGEDGENLRKQLIYNDLINKGFSQEKAMRSVENSFKSGSDIEDAKDALEGLKQFYGNGYKKIREDLKAKVIAEKNAQKEQAEKFRKMVIEDEVKIGETILDKKTKQKVFDAVSKATYKDPSTGNYLTAVQKFQKENPLEFLKQLGMWFVLTDGGKNINALVKSQGRAEKNKAIRELEHKINSTSFNSDGTLKYAGGSSAQDILLSDDWKIG